MDEHNQIVIVNRLLRLSLVSTEQVIGTIGLNAVLRKANLERFVLNLPPQDFDPSISIHDFTHLNQAIEEFFGRASDSILTHIGESIFDQLLRDDLMIQSLAQMQAPILPQPQQRTFVLHEFADLASRLNPEWHVTLEEQAERYVWMMPACPVCLKRTSLTPICYVYTGLLRGAVRYAGYPPRVEETQCIAMGAPACQFELLKTMPQVFAGTPNPIVPIVYPTIR